MPKQLQSRGHLGDPVKQPQTNFNLTMISFKYKQQTRALSTHFKMYNSPYKFIHNTCTYIQTCLLPNARLRYHYKCTVHRQLWVINVLYFNTVYRNHRCRCAKSKWKTCNARMVRSPAQIMQRVTESSPALYPSHEHASP